MLLEGGEEVARAAPPRVEAVDGTAAGDAFTACLVVSLLEGRPREEALAPGVRGRRARRLAARRAAVPADRRRGGRAADATASRSSSTATRATTTRSRSCSRSRAPSSSCSGSRPSRATRRSRRRRRTRSACSSSSAATTCPSPRAPTGRSCASRSSPRTSTARRGLDGPDLPPPGGAASHAHAVDFLAEHAARTATLVAVGPLTNVALLLALHPEAAARADRADGRRDRRGQRHAGRRVQRLGRPGGGAARVRERDRRDDGRPRRHAQGAADARARRRAARARAARGSSSPSCSTSTTASTARPTACRGSPVHDALALAHVIRARPARDRAPARGGRLRVGALPRPDGRRPLAADRERAERPRRASASTATRFVALLLERIASLG